MHLGRDSAGITITQLICIKPDVLPKFHRSMFHVVACNETSEMAKIVMVCRGL